MYLDRKRNRVLLMNGTSITTAENAARMLFEEGDVPDHMMVEMGPDTEAYRTIYDRQLGYEVTSEDLDGPSPIDPDAFDPDLFLSLVWESDRYRSSPETDSRIEEELEFFHESGNLDMLVRCWELVSDMIDDGVVVGVGRGSACASYLMYLLHIHDVDPIKYQIPFSELSKEETSGFES